MALSTANGLCIFATSSKNLVNSWKVFLGDIIDTCSVLSFHDHFLDDSSTRWVDIKNKNAGAILSEGLLDIVSDMNCFQHGLFEGLIH